MAETNLGPVWTQPFWFGWPKSKSICYSSYNFSLGQPKL